jgi:hypothetical protein
MPNPKDFKGKNNLSAKAIFDSRKNYNDFAYSAVDLPSAFSADEELMSLIDNGEAILYGMVDKDFLPIQPKKEFLSSYRNQDGSTVFALNFVVAAFNNFAKAYKLGIASGKASNVAGDLTNLKVSKGRPDTSPFLKKQIDDLSREFGTAVDTSGEIKNILTFRDFLDYYTNFLYEKTASTTITYSAFIPSSNNDLNFNGLCMDISDIPYSKDEGKVENFINNKNFRYYLDTAKSFGFLISKKHPFKLIANLNSPQMRDTICVCSEEYTNNLDADSVDSILDNYYEHPFQDDYNYLFNFLQLSYSNFVNRFPRQLIASVKDGCITKKQVFRKIPTLSEVEKVLADDLMLNFYIKIKNAEARLGFSGSTLQSIVNTAIDIKNEKDLHSALVYANLKFKMTSQIYGSSGAKDYQNKIRDADMKDVVRNSRFNRHKLF